MPNTPMLSPSASFNFFGNYQFNLDMNFTYKWLLVVFHIFFYYGRLGGLGGVGTMGIGGGSDNFKINGVNFGSSFKAIIPLSVPEIHP